MINNNFAMVSGKVVNLNYSHTFSYKDSKVDFYKVTLEVLRLSGKKDFVPVILPENLGYALEKETFIEVFGQVRTHNKIGKDGRNHLEVYVFAKGINIYPDEENVNHPSDNFIELEGYVVKEPKFRHTPLKKSIADLLIATNRSFGNSDYIPCIVWGIVAENCSNFVKIGDKVTLKGRFQSRVYWKQDEENPENGEFRTAYEVSCSELSEEMEPVENI